MKDLITKLVSTLAAGLATGLGGIGTFLVGRGLIAPEEVERLNSTGLGIGEGIALIIVAVLVHLAAKFWGVKREGDSGGANLWIVMMAAACLLGGASLSSCSGYPVTGSIFYRHPDSGAKGGLTFEPGKPAEAFVKVPIYDPQSGKQIGWAELEGPLASAVPTSAK